MEGVADPFIGGIYTRTYGSDQEENNGGGRRTDTDVHACPLWEIRLVRRGGGEYISLLRLFGKIFCPFFYF